MRISGGAGARATGGPSWASVRGAPRRRTDGRLLSGAGVLSAVAPQLQPLPARHPELTVALAVRARMGDLVAEGFDVAVRFIGRKLLDTRVMTCASPAYLARHGTPAHPGELAAGHPFAWEFVRGGLWSGGAVVPVRAAG